MKEETNVLFNVDDGRTIELPLKKILDKIIEDYQCEIIESVDVCSCSFTESNNHCECDGIYEDNILTGYSVSGTQPKQPDNSEALMDELQGINDAFYNLEQDLENINNSTYAHEKLDRHLTKIRAFICGEVL